ncbi:PLP-dependent transferase [Bradyrhizobium glycinis]|uniref:PLP-dependent transferase n=1 Tax=Bradyrhizobium glycinis TaxID=2751812 RepID=UPI0018D6BA15|nr:PLP-dependent transferase [Bradyrhizobium glycinis]MBH5370964.1 PLP-dependent transferase [Bradyrhizobium glycinis]
MSEEASHSQIDWSALQEDEDAHSLFHRLGVEPIINCTGVRTLYGGCNPTRAVRDAMSASSQVFVDLNELAEAIGQKLAALTGAEWGLVTAGSVAAVSQAVAACVAGNDPEKMLGLPLRGDKTVLVAADQRMAYEHAIRAIGCTVTSITQASDLDRLPRESITAICLLGHAIPTSALPFDEIAARANQHRIPLIVDGAGLAPSFPNVWLSSGADLLIHSGGKYIGGPQSTGFLLGSERLCRAAYLNGPPGQSFGRSMKVGKDEIVGAYIALEQWVAQGEAARAMTRWHACISALKREFLGVPGLSVHEIDPDCEFCNPRIAVSWDVKRIPVSSDVIANRLSRARPRIVLHDCWQGPQRIVIDPTNLSTAEAGIVGRSIVRVLTDTPAVQPEPPEVTFENVAGVWEISIEFLHGTATHTVALSQDRQTVTGTHTGAKGSGSCRGVMVGSSLELVSRLPGDPMAMDYEFKGAVTDDELRGIVYLGASTEKHSRGVTFKRQFGQAQWRGRRASWQS